MVRILENRLIINVSVLLVTFGLLLGIAEVSCRVFWEDEIRIENTGTRLSEIGFSPDSSTGYTVSKGIVYGPDGSIREDDYTQFFLPRGARKEKEEGEFRILVLGDSHTAKSSLMNKSNAYTDVLYRLLNSWDDKSDYGIREFQVLPLCFPGFNTEQELLLLKGIGMGYNPDIIILQFCDNDIMDTRTRVWFTDEDTDYDIHINPEVEYVFVDGSIVPVFGFLNKEANVALFSGSHFMRFISYRLNTITFMGNTDYSESFSSIKEMSRMAGEIGIPFMVINFVPARIEHDYCNSEVFRQGKPLHESLKALTDDIGVPLYSMCDYVEDMAEIKSDISPEDDHYNEKGHRIAAGVLRDAVLEEIAHG